MSFSYGLDELDGFPVLALEGSIVERHEADDLLAEVDELITDGDIRMVIDLTDLSYLNSSGLNVLLNVLTKSRNANGEVVICGVNERLKKLLVITKLDAVFQFSSDCQSAVERLNQNTHPPKNT
ncbi:MAG: STAS domain-containing protein [Bacteroidia bacterium]